MRPPAYRPPCWHALRRVDLEELGRRVAVDEDAGLDLTLGPVPVAFLAGLRAGVAVASAVLAPLVVAGVLLDRRRSFPPRP